jgi:hypothetical protein
MPGKGSTQTRCEVLEEVSVRELRCDLQVNHVTLNDTDPSLDIIRESIPSFFSTFPPTCVALKEGSHMDGRATSPI